MTARLVHPFLLPLRRSLIVSCQAQAGEPLHGASIMAAMARAATAGGASAIRCEGPEDVAAIRAVVDVPLIGLWKQGNEGVMITPTREAAKAVAEAGAHMIAIDATSRKRPKGEELEALINFIRDDLRLPVLADVATVDEGVMAAALGADAVAPTLSGYTDYSPLPEDGGPDWDLLRALLGRLACPVLMEGRVRSPGEARRALDAGAWSVVVGSAITRPQQITEHFMAAIASP